jgi:hypothetical protein
MGFASRRRRSFANRLDRIVREVDRHREDSDDLVANREEVVRARHLLLSLIQRLRGPEPLSTHGLSVVRYLLDDSTSPIFAAGWCTAAPAPGSLEIQLQLALAEFDNRDLSPPGMALYG